MDRHEVSAEMSKLDILRGIVSERLSTAAQEIFAVVERTVNNYEEEASRLRQELERQRRHCHALLQPRVQLDSADLHVPQQLPVCEEVVGGGGQPRVEEQQQQQRERASRSPRDGSKCTGSLRLLTVEEHEVEEEDFLEGPGATPNRRQRRLEEDPDYQLPSRYWSPKVQSELVKQRKSWISTEESRISTEDLHLTLRVRILDPSQTNMLSNNVFRKYPMHELKCPLRLQEADFLVLLKTTFPQLAGDDKPFDVFTTDRSRRLQPLKLEMLTPEKIFMALRFTGAGKSALYIRLKS
ncbi:uncharacterized protein LOC130130934 [Lampris incognitus]|uniref:uncharacterized protein LOC130130934 n=1 Tax=Lampris incognitus TaxID=2546036 RepID=UPI0024B592DF|nr:uncharacterized protein LOC130130934 [Lampris incognitus]